MGGGCVGVVVVTGGGDCVATGVAGGVLMTGAGGAGVTAATLITGLLVTATAGVGAGLVGALAGTVALTGVAAATGLGLAAGAGKEGTLEWPDAEVIGTTAGPVPTATTAATTEMAAATPLRDAIVRSRKRWTPEIPAAANAAVAPTAAPDAVAAVSPSGWPNSGDAKTSSRVA
jgi:hypothetical protein